MNDERSTLHAALAAIPGFESLAPDDYSHERRGGLTNPVYRIGTGAGRLMLRIPGRRVGGAAQARIRTRMT